MTEMTHPVAPQHLPFFIPGADGSDPLFTIVIIVLLVVLMTVGVLYLRLHSLPEHLAEKRNSTQMQLVVALTLLALFTQNHAFWILALLLVVLRVPDFLTPISSIAESLKKLAGQEARNANDQSTVRSVSSKDGEK